MLNNVPNRVEPVMKLTEEVTVCTTSVWAVIELVTVSEPVMIAFPLTSSFALGVIVPMPTLVLPTDNTLVLTVKLPDTVDDPVN